ncbi:hypothetical protein GBAR_LOCUS23924 [Geodia barretti]|uniref:Uncharacterized protein n=1 Tax=Geodia barretti TaxID=519541 RepID=A0AA35T9A7_GEOBA|nr:hypothetical protein GBAR_LOCUS23924 [Geodia barretti]
MYCTALSSYRQCIQDGLLACLSVRVLTKSTKYLGHLTSIIQNLGHSNFNGKY